MKKYRRLTLGVYVLQSQFNFVRMPHPITPHAHGILQFLPKYLKREFWSDFLQKSLVGLSSNHRNNDLNENVISKSRNHRVFWTAWFLSIQNYLPSKVATLVPTSKSRISNMPNLRSTYLLDSPDASRWTVGLGDVLSSCRAVIGDLSATLGGVMIRRREEIIVSRSK